MPTGAASPETSEKGTEEAFKDTDGSASSEREFMHSLISTSIYSFRRFNNDILALLFSVEVLSILGC